jgi:UDP-N-acetylglucosamine 2-epimerase (non-hydrolysing)
LQSVAELLPVVFPIHPRTKQRLESKGLISHLSNNPRIILLEPQPYVGFMARVLDAALVITDSGGIQEETSYLGIPCLTVRENTERPITVSLGTNRLVSMEGLLPAVEQTLAANRQRRPANIPLWDGKTAGRAVASLKNWFEGNSALETVLPAVGQ